MERLERIVTGLLRPINPYATLLLGFMTTFWGLWIFSPYWEVFTHAQVFSKADSFAPEWAWGLWSMTAGMIIIAAVAKGSYRVLTKALAFAVWHWFTIALFFWWGDWQNTAGIVYTFVALTALYCHLNIKFNAEEMDKEHF